MAFSSLSATALTNALTLRGIWPSKTTPLGARTLAREAAQPVSPQLPSALRPPLLRRANGKEKALEVTGLVLGTGLGAAYTESTLTLGPQDALLLMTGDVSEARNGESLGSAGTWWMLRAALADDIGGSRRDDMPLRLRRTRSG